MSHTHVRVGHHLPMATGPADPGRYLTDAEALMWSVDRDPWLDPSGGSITLFDRPLDVERFRRDVARTVAATPRLRQRVVEPATPMSPPHWEVDREFDLDDHVRHVGAPGDGSPRALLDWMTTFLAEPYDRGRPLWQYVVFDGVEGGRGAVAQRLHHVVLDGAAAVEASQHYTSRERHPDEPPAVDLDALVAETPDDHAGWLERLGEPLRRPFDIGRQIADTLTHPERLLHLRREVEDLARSAFDQLRPSGADLWRGRSRRRVAEAMSVEFDRAHAAASALGGSLNDLFMTAVVEAAARYHADHGAELEHLHATFVVSTRRDHADASNAFTPVPVDLPAGPMPLAERFGAVRAALAVRRRGVHGGGPFAAMASVAAVLPPAVVSAIGRSQSAHIDVATSNLPGLLEQTYCAGAAAQHTYVLGPVAGTACNITLYTTVGSVDVGMHIDPAAVADPRALRDHLESAFEELMQR